jgi:hypothetical protein
MVGERRELCPNEGACDQYGEAVPRQNSLGVARRGEQSFDGCPSSCSGRPGGSEVKVSGQLDRVVHRTDTTIESDALLAIEGMDRQ